MRSTHRRPLVIALALAALAATILSAPRPAAAHPLGNFSINSYARVEPGGAGLRLRYVLDMAEIPTFQQFVALGIEPVAAQEAAGRAALADSLAGRLVDGLRLEANGTRLPLVELGRAIELRPGQGGLLTLFLRLDLSAPLPAGQGPWQVSYRDPVFSDRPGWHEVVVRPAGGVELLESSVPTEDLSRELSAYPEDLLQAPPTADGASFTFGLAALGAAPEGPAVAPARATVNDPLTALTSAPITGPLSLGAALLAALVLGAGHALTPGHGKTVVAAYLVGARGTIGHAIFLGLTTTVTHTAGVFALGLVTLFVSEWVLPEQLYPWLGAVSGVLVALIGATLLRQRLGAFMGRPAGHDHSHDHDHSHSHTHEHSHDHGHGHDHGFGYHTHAPPEVSWRGLLALGISGGLLPCPSALVLLLGAVALGRPGLGLLLVLGFSVGLAAVLTAIGVLLVRARALFTRLPAGGRLLPGLSLAGAAVVTVVGVAITLQALAQTGLLG